MLAYTADAWTQVIVALSIFVPVVVAVVLTVWVLRGARNDPDEQRWRRLQQQEHARARSGLGQVGRRVDVGDDTRVELHDGHVQLVVGAVEGVRA